VGIAHHASATIAIAIGIGIEIDSGPDSDSDLDFAHNEMADLPFDPATGVLACGGGRDLAVLRPASVPWRLLGPQRRMGPIAGGPGRKLVLQIAGCAALVFQ